MEAIKYVWVARATLHKASILELVFDASELHTGFYCLLINVFGLLRNFMTTWLRKAALQHQLLKAFAFEAHFILLLLQDLELSLKARVF